MKQIYCISGLGADENVFANLRPDGYQLRHIPWLQPVRNEKIADYAKRMAGPIQGDDPVLIGVSFGGMIGIEIARQMALRKLFIVSSIKATGEMPRWMRVAGSLSLNRLIPMRPYKLIEKMDYSRNGVSTPEEIEMVRNYRKKADPVYLQWAVNNVLNWKNNWQPDHITHIHGDQDRIFPLKYLAPHHVIKGGTHLMIYNRAAEIGEVINRELAK